MIRYLIYAVSVLTERCGTPHIRFRIPLALSAGAGCALVITMPLWLIVLGVI